MPPHNYGVLSCEDAPFWENVVSQVAARWAGDVVMLEVGVGTGGTATGTAAFCAGRGWSFSWVGLDGTDVTQMVIPKSNAKFIHGNFHDEAINNQVPDDAFNLVFIDGCHCLECVKNDFWIFAPKLVVGGTLAFHDTHPNWQGKHVQCQPDRFIGVRAALSELELLPCVNPLYRFTGEQDNGNGHGFRTYEKIG